MINDIKSLRKAAGMTQQDFAKYFGIGYRTIQACEGKVNNCKPWILSLIEYKLRNEGYIK